MEVHDVKLVISAVEPKQYPRTDYPEIALVGRSNVGKSTLTNTLINRANYAHTSNKPGKTQTLNFYEVEHQLYFVDVPGYGYAKVSKAERERFGQMIEQYLSTRDQLKGVIQLVDSRHAPSQDDVLMINWLGYYQIPTLVVGTKTDKVKSSARNKVRSQIKKTLQLTNQQPLVLFSAPTKQGADSVWHWINKQCGL